MGANLGCQGSGEVEGRAPAWTPWVPGVAPVDTRAPADPTSYGDRACQGRGSGQERTAGLPSLSLLRGKGTTIAEMSSLGQCCPGASGPDSTGTPKKGHSGGEKGPPRRPQRQRQGKSPILSRSFVLREQRPGVLPAKGPPKRCAALRHPSAVSCPGVCGKSLRQAPNSV